MRVIISGGGTGGHIFPAIAIADEFRRRFSDVEILFVGAKGKMEEVRVPKAGYEIECLEIAGFDRGAMSKNLKLPVKIYKSLRDVRKILKRFNPDVVIGVGGFASAPTLFMASMMGIPTFVQEQNAYPGITNKIVSKKAKCVFVAYDDMDKFFGKGKVLITGNPIRKDVVEIEGKREEAIEFFGLDEGRRTLLIVGGSLGAKSINDCIKRDLDKLTADGDIQLIWQTGQGYEVEESLIKGKPVKVVPFIDRMDLAYAAADVIISRAGAIAISELCCVGKPVIFVPFPYASEDHQTKNAMSLVNKEAAICIKNENIGKELTDCAVSLFADEKRMAELSKNIKKLELKNAAERIVDSVVDMVDMGVCEDKAKKRIFFVGIGGIGMSALARYYKANGYEVSGYDSTPSVITDALINEGINVSFVNDLREIDREAELVIYTPAVKENMAYDYYTANKVPMIKRSEALARIVDNYRTIAVAGTHGKTTTSTMIAHLMKASNAKCNSFLGGISSNYDTNLLLSDTAVFAVTEADEFDRSFLKLNPSVSVITSADADHLDIYNNKESLEQAFEEYGAKAKELLIVKHGLGLDLSKAACEVVTYSMNDKSADCYADNIRHKGKETIYDIVFGDEVVKDVRLSMPGLINVENSLAAFLAAKRAGLTDDQIKDALATFKGVKRRFDFITEREDFVYIDDYCHHPSEISAFVSSIRVIYPNKRLTGVFQPHLYSRTKDFADGFAESLSMLDEVILLEIYPAREKPMAGVDSKMILDKISNPNKYLVSKDQLIDKIKELKPEVLMTMGAGDIDRFVNVIKKEMI